MLLTSEDILQITTTTTAPIDIYISSGDRRETTSITSATTTAIAEAPILRQKVLDGIYIKNKHASTSQTCTLKIYDGATTYSLLKFILAAGERFEWTDAGLFFYNPSGNLLGGGLGDSFETVNKNLSAVDGTLAYDGSNRLTSVTYTSGVVKTLAYTGDDLTSVTLSGSTPSGIDLVKTLSYTDGSLTGISYS
jgi:YD repeat-containing protein